MIFKEKNIILKNGIQATFKTPEITDAEKLLDYLKAIYAETDFLSAEDCEHITLKDEQKWLAGKRESENALTIACYINNEIAGNCTIIFLDDGKRAHRASVGIAIPSLIGGFG